MLVTTNYQMINYVKNPINIDKNPPWWFKGPSIICLAPKDDLIYLWNMSKITFDEFKFRFYYDVLRKCDAWEILRDIKRLSNTEIENCSLLNNESSQCINTRSFISDWLNKCTGINVKEYELNDEKENQKIDIMKSKSYLDSLKYKTYEEIEKYIEERKYHCENEKSLKLINEL